MCFSTDESISVQAELQGILLSVLLLFLDFLTEQRGGEKGEN